MTGKPKRMLPARQLAILGNPALQVIFHPFRCVRLPLHVRSPQA